MTISFKGGGFRVGGERDLGVKVIVLFLSFPSPFCIFFDFKNGSWPPEGRPTRSYGIETMTLPECRVPMQENVARKWNNYTRSRSSRPF